MFLTHGPCGISAHGRPVSCKNSHHLHCIARLEPLHTQNAPQICLAQAATLYPKCTICTCSILMLFLVLKHAGTMLSSLVHSPSLLESPPSPHMFIPAQPKKQAATKVESHAPPRLPAPKCSNHPSSRGGSDGIELGFL